MKMLRIILSLLVIALVLSCSNNTDKPLYPIANEDGLFGYIDNDGELSIDHVFDAAANFSFGVALVLKDDKFYYIDKSGDSLFAACLECPPLRDSESVGAKSIAKLLLDLQGQPKSCKEYFFQIEKDYSFNRGLALTRNRTGKYGYLNTKGDTVVKAVYDGLKPFKYGYGLFTKSMIDSDNTDTKAQNKRNMLDLAEVEGISDDVIQGAVDLANMLSKKSWQGLVNSSGREIFERRYDKILGYTHNSFLVELKAENHSIRNIDGGITSYNADRFIIDKNEKVISPVSNSDANVIFFSDYLIGFHNYFSELTSGIETAYYIVDNEFNRINFGTQGNMEFGGITKVNKNDVIGVKRNEYWYLVNLKTLKFRQDSLKNCIACDNGDFLIQDWSNKWGIVGSNGYQILNAEYDSLGCFYKDLAYSEKHNLNTVIRGYLNRDGKYVYQDLIKKSEARFTN